jgi:hypothetical protein
MCETCEGGWSSSRHNGTGGISKALVALDEAPKRTLHRHVANRFAAVYTVQALILNNSKPILLPFHACSVIII